MQGVTPVVIQVLDLRLQDPGSRWLAIAVVSVGPVVIHHVRVIERNGRLKIRLPGVTLDQPLFLDVVAEVLAEFRRAVDTDPWADLRSVPSARAVTRYIPL